MNKTDLKKNTKKQLDKPNLKYNKKIYFSVKLKLKLIKPIEIEVKQKQI